MSRVLITGGSGYLGRHLIPLAEGVHEVVHTFYHNDVLGTGTWLDIRDEAAVTDLVNRFQPEVIIHTAGSDRSPDSDAVIRSGTAHIAGAAAAVRARLIHLSTDVLFNGREAPYDEESQPKPLHAYGRAKADAESSIYSYDNHVIIRTSLMYGLTEIDRGTEWIVQSLRDQKPVTLFTDQRRNPIWVETLSHAVLELANNIFVGVLNVAGRQVLSRADFGRRMLEWWGVETRDTITLGSSDPDRWPADLELDLTLAKVVLSTPLLGVDEVLSRVARPGTC